jgi:Phage conserved hypothetical protein BR0599/Uncharacterized conserved protein (DUF2163)
MKTISSSLTNFLLDNVTFNRCDLITMILQNNQVMNVLYGTNYTSITYPTLAASVTVGGGAAPWSYADPTYPFASTGQSSPVSIAMSQGQVIILQYASGTISLHFGILPVDANGGSGAIGQFNPSSQYTNGSPGNYIQPLIAPPASLIGGFADSAGYLISPPFFIGDFLVIGPAPANTTQLLIGVNDIYYTDNTGSWTINIVPSTYYSSLYGAWERGPFTNKADFKLSTETMKLTGLVPETVLYPGTTTPLMQAINTGMLNTAKVIIQTLFWPLGSPPSSGFSMGTMQLMTGQIGNVKNTGRSKIECDVYDLTYILNRPFPPHMIQTACRHTFCDAGCTLFISNYQSTPQALESTSSTLYLDFNIANWNASTNYGYGNLIVNNNVIYMCSISGESGSSAPTFNSTNGVTTTDNTTQWTSMGSYAAGTAVSYANGSATQAYPLGYVLGITGQNTGLKRSVKVQTTSATGGYPELQLLWPLPFPVAAGDTFELFAGCDKTLATCTAVYNNTIHFGGTPFVPNPEIAE